MKHRIHRNRIKTFLLHLVIIFYVYNISKSIALRKPKGKNKIKKSRFDVRYNSCLNTLKSLQFPS